MKIEYGSMGDLKRVKEMIRGGCYQNTFHEILKELAKLFLNRIQ